MRILLLFSTILLGVLTLSAQDTLMLEDSPTKKMEYRKGPNSGHFTHMYYSVKFPMPPQNEGSEVIVGKSYGMEFGYKNKIRLGNFYSLGFNFAYAFNRYRMAQDEGKVTPDTWFYDKQSVRNNEWRVGFYNRFNFDIKRGNTMGKYLDLGVYGTYHFYNKVYTETETDNTTVIHIHRKLDYVEPWGYGAFANLGFGSFALTVDYRLSNYFKEDAGFPELPPLAIGVQFGIHD